MKKILFLLSLLCLSYLSKAQEIEGRYLLQKKDQWIGIGYGFIPRYRSYFDDEIKIEKPYLYQFRTHKSVGPISLYYERAITKKISIRGLLTIGNVNSEILLTDTTAGKNDKDSFNLKLIYAGALVNVNYHYGHSSKFDPYVGVGLGYGYAGSYGVLLGNFGNYQEITTTLPQSFLYSIRTGINYFINPDLALNAEAGLLTGCYFNLGVMAKW